MEDRLSDVLFSDPFLTKRSNHESQKSGFRFDLKNPLEVWILWINDPFLDFRVRFFGRIRKRISDPRSYGFSTTKKTTNPKMYYFAMTRQDEDTQNWISDHIKTIFLQ